MSRKITQHTEMTALPDLNDLLHIVDVSDTTDAATGTNKSIKVASLLQKRTVSSLYTYGAVGDGVADDSAAFVAAQAAGETIFITNGTFKIDQDLTLTIPINFLGGVIQVETGHTLTISNCISAPFYEIFTGAGSVDISDSVVEKVVPQWWGAVGDTSTDDTPAFEAALATGKPVFVPVPDGQYIVGDLLIPDQTVLYGETGLNVGFSSVTAMTVLRAKSGATTILDISGCRGTHIHDLVVHGVDKSVHGICAVTDDSTNMQIHNVAVLFCDYAVGAESGYYIGGSWITNCNLGISEYGLIRLLDSHINHNKIRTNNQDGIYLPTGMNDCMITGNKIEWNQGYGIHCLNSKQSTITGNLIDRAFKAGVLADSTDGTTITGNVIRRSGKNGTSEQRSQILLKNTNTKLVISGNTGTVGRDDGTYDITNITQANPAVVTSADHGRTTGDTVFIEDNVGGMTQIHNTEALITVIDDDTFSLDGVDSTGYSAYTSGGTYKEDVLSPDYGIEFVNSASAEMTIVGNDFSGNVIDEYIGQSTLTNATISRNNGKELIIGRDINTELGKVFQDKQSASGIASAGTAVLNMTQQPTNTFINAPRELQVVVRNQTTGADYYALFPLLLRRESGSASILAGGVYGEAGTSGAITISGAGTVVDLVISNVATDGATFDITATNNAANNISVSVYLI